MEPTMDWQHLWSFVPNPFSTRKPRPTSRRPVPVRLSLENLEERIVLSTIPVHAGDSIQAAVNVAQNGDKIEVDAGTYKEQVVFDHKQITVHGAGAQGTIILSPDSMTATGWGEHAIVELKNQANIGLSNLTISGPGPDG